MKELDSEAYIAAAICGTAFIFIVGGFALALSAAELTMWWLLLPALLFGSALSSCLIGFVTGKDTWYVRALRAAIAAIS